MSVIIRLQNLSWNAHALDIRQFFKGMSIPDGGVHIVGGDLGDAFIAFSTDEDARRAMMLNGQKLNGVMVKSLLSSKTEMQKVIAAARGGNAVDKDDRHGLPMAQISVPPPFIGSTAGPYSQPPPPIPPHSNRLRPGPVEPPSGNLGRNAGFNQPSFPSHGGPPRGVPPPPALSGRNVGSRYSGPPVSGPVSPAERAAPRPDTISSEKPDVLRADVDSERKHRAGIVLYDRAGGGDARRNIEGQADRAKPEVRDQAGREEHGKDRSEGFDRRMREERHDSRDRRDHRHGRDEARRDSARRSYEPERNSRGSVDDKRSRERHDDGRRCDERDRHGREDSRERRDVRKRERLRSRDRSEERRHDRHRERHDSREKRPRYHSPEGEYRVERSRQFMESRARYGPANPLNGDKNKDLHDPGTCVFISQLPVIITYKDIRRFFNKEKLPLPENGLKLENDEFGNRNGNAYIRFMTEECRDRALGLRGQLLEGAPLIIERCTMAEYEQAVDSFVPQDHRRKGIEQVEKRFFSQRETTRPDMMMMGRRSPRPPVNDRKQFFETCCVMIRNLPSRVERCDVRAFFKHLRITVNGVYIPYDNKGSCLGVAYIEFETVAEAEEALRRYDNTEFMISKHLLDMYPITMAEAKERIDRHKTDFTRGNVAPRHMERAPDDRRHARREDFRDEERHDSRRDEHRSGRSYRYDDSREREMWHEKMREEQKFAANAPVPHHPHPNMMKEAVVAREHVQIANQKYQCVKLNGLPLHADVGLVEGFFFDLSVRPNGIHVVFSPDARCIGEAYVEFTNIDDCTKALQRDNTVIDKRVLRVSPVLEGDMVAQLNNHKVNDQYIVSRATPEAPGQPCDVIMSNVPFKATMLDVSQFLQGTAFIPESILFEVDQQGNAMGNAKVTFINSQAAHRALLTLLRKEFHGRVIKFKVV